MSKETANDAPALNEQDVLPVVGIITALPHEYAAVKVLLETQRPIFVAGRGAGRQYLYGEVPAPNGDRHRIVLALLPDTGNDHASARAALLLTHFPSVHTVIMSGIAGGIPNPDKPAEHVRLGDIVVSNREGVIQYDFGKEELIDGKIEFTPRHPPRPPSASLVETARLLQAGELEGERPWVRYIERGVERLSAAHPPADTDVLVSSADPNEVITHPDDPRRVNDLPRIFLGPIASSNTLLKNPLKRDQLRDRFGVKAIEMEGSGIADAAWTIEIQYLVVRGVCDYCDSRKGDEWQVYAAVVAAAYTRALLEATPAVSIASRVPVEGRGVKIAGDVDRSVIVTGDNNQITINPSPSDAASLELSRGATFNVLSSQLESLSSELSDEKSERLEELRELFREGAMKDAYEGVLQFRRSPNWAAFSNRLRAMVLRAQATMCLSLKKADGVAEASGLADEASRIDPGGDDLTLRARIKVYADGHVAALKELANPLTLDAFNLRLALLLETGRVAEALSALRNPPEGIVFGAETKRLYALALLASKDVQGAQEQISQVLVERPRRLNARFNSAVINYCSALSPLALPPRLIPYPRPIQSSMVKQDVASRDLLLKAAEEFRLIAEGAQPASDERKTFETWHVACLANLPDRHERAVELCKERLTEDPGDARIIPWVLFRRYDLDLSESLAALERSLEEPDDDRAVSKLEKLLALIGIHLRHGTYQEALELIEKRKILFTSADELDLWKYWRAQLFVAADQAQTALDDSSQIEDPALRRAIRTNSLFEIANKSGDWQPLFSHLEKSYEEENDTGSLFILCELKAQLGDWPYVADRAELYCNAIGTASAARFVFAAAWNAKRPARCLRLLDQYKPFFPDGNLPAELRRLRVHCLINTGDIKAASSEAERLAEEDSSVENVVLLMDVHLIKGDLTGLEVSARHLLRQGGLTPEQLLRAAHLVQLNNPSLAKKFWLRAVEGAAEDPETTAFAVHMAAKLGVENQRGSLMQRMMEYAEQGQGPMKVMTMEQTLEMMREGKQRQEQLEEMYAASEAPLQFLAKGGLAQVFRGLTEWNRGLADSHHKKRILIRHGGRILPAIDYAKGAKNWRLHCDVTALLLAHEVGVLEKIEKLFKPLRISRNVTTALIAQRDKLKPHQQSVVDESRTVLDLVSKGKLRVLDGRPPDEWLDAVSALVAKSQKEGATPEEPPEGSEEDKDAAGVIFADADSLETQLGRNRLEMLAAALAEEGFAVGFLPVTCYGVARHALLRLPESLNNRVINCRSVADSLRCNGRITEDAYTEALKALGVEGNPHATASSLIGSTLFLMQGVAGVLARASLLERACNNFDVFISPSCVQEAEETVRHYERLARIADWLSDLINRISDGLDDGTYEFISLPDERIAQRDAGEDKLEQEFTATLDLFLFEPRQWDVIWVDDRALNKYPFRGDERVGVPITGISEILLALKTAGELDENDYYDILLRLRESDFRYLPLSEDEILHHLKQARIQDGRVIENEALSSIRRYYASCLLDKNILQLTSTHDDVPNPHSELPFVVQVVNAIANAIAGVWSDEKADVRAATARADWILNNLYTGNYGCSHLRRDNVPQSSVFTPEKVIALDISNLLMRGVSMHGDPLVNESMQRRNYYFNWITERVITSSYASNRKVVKATAAEVQKRLEFLKEQNFEPPQHELFAQVFLGKLFLDLPNIISTEIEFDGEMKEWLRLRIGSTATVAGINFAADEYWRAAEAALSSGDAAIESQDSDAEYHLIRTTQGNSRGDNEELFPGITITDSNGNKVGEVRDPSFGLLLSDVQSRRAALDKLRTWFDCGQKEFKEKADELVSIEDAAARVTRLYEWRSRSSELYYSDLGQKFRANEPVFWFNLLPPSAESFAGRFRLPLTTEGKGFSDVWRESAGILLREEDLPTAVARLAGVPVAMPEAIIDAASSLPEGERLEFLGQLAKAWTTPIRRLHLVNLILRSTPVGGAGIDIARSVLDKLYDEDAGLKDFISFHSVLALVNEEFGAWEEGRRWSTGVKMALAWAHAARLHNLFRSLGMSDDSIVSMLKHGRRSSFRDAIVRDSETWNDCTHPSHLTRARLLTHGVACMLADVDPAMLEAVGLPELIRKEVFREAGEGRHFHESSLLSDPSLCQDSFASLLGGDRHALLSQIIGSEGIEILSDDSLKESVKASLEELAADPTRFVHWAWIHAVTDDLQIYPELRELCRSALETFDPFVARKDGFTAAWFAFRAAAHQVMHLGEEALRQKYRDNVLEMVKREVAGVAENAADGEFQSLERRVASLIDVASVLSSMPNDAVAANKEFTSLLEAIAEHWSEFSAHYRQIISREVWNLPIEESESWWHLTLRMRAAEK